MIVSHRTAMSIAILLAAASPPSVPVPPAIVSTPAPHAGANTTVLITFTSGPVTCEGQTVTGTIAQPVPAVANLWSGQAVAPFDFSFRIDVDGRPLGITPAPRSMTGLYFQAEDLQPALAASRFAAGAARASCTISFTPTVRPVATAPMDDVYRYLALPHRRGHLDEALVRRVREASPGCFAGKPPTVLTRVFPDLDAIPQPSGALSASVVVYDIDGSGKPVRVRTLMSDGNTVLDAAARKAVSESRFGRDARTGCTASFFRRQSTPLAPPPTGPISAYRSNPACDEDGWQWQLPPRMTFPEPFRRRGIEGAAVIRYDVAPWGETGNVTVLASEPAAMFGTQAQQIIRAAKRPPSSTGATGCVDRVVFKLPDGYADDPTPPAPPPIID